MDTFFKSLGGFLVILVFLVGILSEVVFWGEVITKSDKRVFSRIYWVFLVLVCIVFLLSRFVDLGI